MNTLKNFALKKPIFFSILLIIVTVAITYIPMDLFASDFLDDQSINYIAGILEQTLVSLFLILMLKQFKLLSSAGFTNIKQWKSLWIVWPMIVFPFLNLSNLFCGDIKIDTSKPLIIVLYILVYSTTGLFEETLCRGVVLTLMLHKWGSTNKGSYLALIVSSFLFGFTHMIHYFLHDSSLLATATQIIYATFIGVIFGAFVIRNKTIFPAMVLHALFDITGGLNELSVNGGIKSTYLTITFSDAIVNILIMLPLFIYGLFLFRKVLPSDLSFSTKVQI